MKNTALSAKNETIIFKNDSHQKFYKEWILKCRYQDVYHKALVVLQRMAMPFLGISEDTRKHVRQIYNFETGCVNTECLMNGWITSGSAKVIRMAFNLYCNGAPSVDDYKDHGEQLSECRAFGPN